MADDLQKQLNELTQNLAAAEAGNPNSVNPLSVRRGRMLAMTAGQLRAACAKNSDHPLASEKFKSVQGYGDNHPIICELADIQSLLNDVEVETCTTLRPTQDGKQERVIEKRLKAHQPDEPVAESA